MIELNRIFRLLLLVNCGCGMLASSAVKAGDQPEFSSLISVQGFGAVQNLVDDSILNPGNILKIPETVGEIDVRPDFHVSWQRLDVTFKPRLESRWQRIEDSTGSEDTDHTEAFVNEWRVRARLSDELLASYGRENLQWGPSYLLSPSNPFNQNNGRNNPYLEVPGLDYARVLWIPNDAWSLSFIANTDEGRLNTADFNPAYAVKLDYTGERRYFSLIPSLRDDSQDTTALGFYGGVSATDALLLYLEGSVSDEEQGSKGLLGGSYTFSDGSNMALEYFYQEDGCTLAFPTCVLTSDGGVTPGNLDSVPLQREKYLFLQYYKNWDAQELDLGVRVIHGLDDQSSRLVLILQKDLGDHVELFAVGNLTSGGPDTEFGSLIDSSFFTGLDYTF